MSAPQKLVVGDDWKVFYETPSGLMASGLARNSLQHIPLSGDVLTLGFTVLNDPMFFLEHGFRTVHNVNLSTTPPQHLDHVRKKYGARFRHDTVSVTDLHLPPNRFDAVVSNHGIAYHPDIGFDVFFQNIKASVRSDGVLAVTLYGPEDEWLFNHRGYSSHNKDEIEKLFAGFDIKILREYKLDSYFIDVAKTPKRWHYFSIVATKKTELV